MVSEELNNYGYYINPLVSDILKSLGIQKKYIKAEGHTITYEDTDGNTGELLDVACGYGSLMFGHNHPRLIAKLQDFLESKIPVHAQFSYRTGSGLLAKKLAEMAKKYVNEDYILRFANSGTESVDLAVKHCEFKRVLKMQNMVDKLNHDLNELDKNFSACNYKIPGDIFANTELREMIFDDYLTPVQLRSNLTRLNAKALSARPMIFALKKAFHGKSIGACQMTYSKDFRRAFLYFGLFCFFIDPDDILEMEMIIEDLKETFYSFEIIDNVITLSENPFPNITAIIAEPIQGEGGIHIISDLALQDLKMISEDKDVPLIFDEIQCGMGRTGDFFASRSSGVTADIYLIAKSIGGGLIKNSCIFIKKNSFEKPFGIIHTSTFAEDDLSAAVGLEVLEMLEENNGQAYERAKQAGDKIISHLNELKDRYPDVIREVRGKGLMIGVEFYDFEYADSPVFRNIQKWKVIGYMIFSYLHEVECIRALPSASAPSTIRIEPGVNITDAEIDKLINGFNNLCKIISNNDGYHLIHHITTQDRKNKSAEIKNNKTGEYKKEYLQYKSKKPAAKVGFIGHPLNLEAIKSTVPELARLTIEERRGMYTNTTTIRSNAPLIPIRIQSKFGREVDVCFYVLSRTTEQIVQDINSPGLKDLQDAMYEIAREAKDSGCSVLGFGGFTSIASNNCKGIKTIPGLAYTSGNSLTTGLGYNSMLNGGRRRGKNLDESTALVVGGAGNIGQVYASLLTEEIPRIILLGSRRKGSVKRLSRAYKRIYNDIAVYLYINYSNEINGIGKRLISLTEIRTIVHEWVTKKELPENAGELLSAIIKEKYSNDPFLIVTDEYEMIQEADFIACTANAPESFIGNDVIKENVIICDLGVPANVKDEVRERNDIEFMQGGLAKLPNDQEIPGGFMNVQPGFAYGCLTETIVMGLMGMQNHYSYGDITREQVKEITALADSQGFTLADEYRVGEKF